MLLLGCQVCAEGQVRALADQTHSPEFELRVDGIHYSLVHERFSALWRMNPHERLVPGKIYGVIVVRRYFIRARHNCQ
jgi:hypothetical protein